MPAFGRSAKSLRVTVKVVVASLAAEALLLGTIYWTELASLHAGTHGVTFNWAPDPPSWRKFEHPGVDRPPALASERAKLGRNEEVVGIVVGGRARAYRLRALAHPERHIVNDLVGGVPVSVTYCDLTDCLRAFAGPPGSASLDVSQAGLFDHEMVLTIAGFHYRQQTAQPLADEAGTPPLPYSDLHPERTTWEAWTRLHPQTDVYVGPD